MDNSNYDNNNIGNIKIIMFPIAFVQIIIFFSANNIECRLPRQRKGPEPGSNTPRDERIVRWA